MRQGARAEGAGRLGLAPGWGRPRDGRAAAAAAARISNTVIASTRAGAGAIVLTALALPAPRACLRPPRPLGDRARRRRDSAGKSRRDRR
ncbi:hypothetical protein B0A89_14375 (plasmid) [Paracoccus contaminans]|uniref:Uncharacterized protein n=1 Tax=Paracoccus contaminans TaxID=1945662 RepID=A0A1W6D1U4_9RHOB|nr:hypothetical protein B0A89_14375 [Paracoccus contaminans]